MNLKADRTISALWRNDDGVAAMEAALVFPLLLMLLMGTFDMGNAIVANTKVVRASQTVADLVTRKRTVTQADIDEAVDAGRLAFQPIDDSTYGVDITSIEFDEDGDVSINWRETVNMPPDPDVLNRVDMLGEENSGLVVVSVRYRYTPFFAAFITDDISMMETAFARGRKSAVVERE